MSGNNRGDYKDIQIPNIRRGPGGPMSRFMPSSKPKNTIGTLKRLWGFYMRELPMLIFILFLVLASTLLSLAAPYLIGLAVDSFDIKTGVLHASRFINVLTFLLIVYLAGAAFEFLRGYLMTGVSQKLVKGLRKTLFDKLQKLPLTFFDTNSHGDIMSRISNDIDNISSTIAQTTTQFMSSLIMILGSLVLMLVMSPVLTLAALIVVPLVFTLSKTVTTRTREYFREQQRLLGIVNGRIEENITGSRIVKAFQREALEIEEFKEVNDNLRAVSVKAQIWSGTMMPMMNVINNIGFTSITCVGAFLALRGAASAGTITSFLSYSRYFSRPLNDIAAMLNVIQSALAGAERVFEILDRPEEPADTADAKELMSLRGDIGFKNVYFSYTKDSPVLHDVSFDVRRGEIVALVGPTGAGKTTIVNLLTRFYELDSGAIHIDGTDITKYTRRSLRGNFSVVLQDMTLFTDTIEENIRYGRPDATREEVIAAAKMAYAHSFIIRLPNGYDTVVSNDSEILSAGQRQLLAIARAALSDAQILILDEATSNVDTRTEIKIQQAMLSLTRNKTCFIIAHRLSTIRDADRIFVIFDGKIKESGNHESLIARKGLYYEMERTMRAHLDNSH